MDEPFDPYHVWLGIPPSEQPPNHYRLLGLQLFESSSMVIDSAADRMMAHVKSFESGPFGTYSQRVLNELAAARLTLLRSEKRSAYDAQLQASLVQPASLPASSPLAEPPLPPVPAFWEPPVPPGGPPAEAPWAAPAAPWPPSAPPWHDPTAPLAAPIDGSNVGTSDAPIAVPVGPYGDASSPYGAAYVAPAEPMAVPVEYGAMGPSAPVPAAMIPATYLSSEPAHWQGEASPPTPMAEMDVARPPRAMAARMRKAARQRRWSMLMGVILAGTLVAALAWYVISSATQEAGDAAGVDSVSGARASAGNLSIEAEPVVWLGERPPTSDVLPGSSGSSPLPVDTATGQNAPWAPGQGIVIRRSARVQRAGAVLGMLDANWRMRIQQIEGPWLGVALRIDGQQMNGWIHARHVVPASEAGLP